jgi:hypothetical protein
VFKSIKAKLGNQRKEKSWVIYPGSKQSGPQAFGVAVKDPITIQCDDRIAVFDPATGKGLLSVSKKGAGFIFLRPEMGATFVQVPPEIVAAALAAQPKQGDEIGPGVYVG